MPAGPALSTDAFKNAPTGTPLGLYLQGYQVSTSNNPKVQYQGNYVPISTLAAPVFSAGLMPVDLVAPGVATPNDQAFVRVVTSGGTSEVVFPAAPWDGMLFGLGDVSGSASVNTITVSTNGLTIENQLGSFVGPGGTFPYNRNSGRATWMYSAARSRWEIQTFL